MARLCGICTAANARDINARIMTGVPIAQIARETFFSDSALRRHASGHLSRLSAVPTDTTATTDLLDRLQLALDDVDRVRAAALATNRGDLVVKAATAARQIIESLTTHLGVDDLEVTKLIADGHNLARAVGFATRQNPELGRLVARRLAALSPDDTTDADTLDALAASVEQKKILTTTKETRP